MKCCIIYSMILQWKWSTTHNSAVFNPSLILPTSIAPPMTNKEPHLPSPLQLFQRTLKIIPIIPIPSVFILPPYIFIMLSLLFLIHPQIAHELLFECLPIIEQKELFGGFVWDVWALAVKGSPTSFCALLFAVEFCPADLVAIYVINSVGVVGASVVYSCESTVFVGFVADASAAAKGTNSSWHSCYFVIIIS